VLTLLGLVLAAFYDFLFVMMIRPKARNPAPKDSKVSCPVAIFARHLRNPEPLSFRLPRRSENRFIPGCGKLEGHKIKERKVRRNDFRLITVLTARCKEQAQSLRHGFD